MRLQDTYIQYGVDRELAARLEGINLPVTTFRNTSDESLAAHYGLSPDEIRLVKECSTARRWLRAISWGACACMSAACTANGRSCRSRSTHRLYTCISGENRSLLSGLWIRISPRPTRRPYASEAGTSISSMAPYAVSASRFTRVRSSYITIYAPMCSACLTITSTDVP